MQQVLHTSENINILIVEDDFISYLLITEYLMPLKFNLYRASNYVETWELLHSNHCCTIKVF